MDDFLFQTNEEVEKSLEDKKFWKSYSGIFELEELLYKINLLSTLCDIVNKQESDLSRIITFLESCRSCCTKASCSLRFVDFNEEKKWLGLKK